MDSSLAFLFPLGEIEMQVPQEAIPIQSAPSRVGAYRMSSSCSVRKGNGIVSRGSRRCRCQKRQMKTLFLSERGAV